MSYFKLPNKDHRFIQLHISSPSAKHGSYLEIIIYHSIDISLYPEKCSRFQITLKKEKLKTNLDD